MDPFILKKGAGKIVEEGFEKKSEKGNPDNIDNIDQTMIVRINATIVRVTYHSHN